MEKVINRLKDVYRGRTDIENKLVSSIRHQTNPILIKELVLRLTEYRGRIQELESLLTIQQISEIKSELGDEKDQILKVEPIN